MMVRTTVEVKQLNKERIREAIQRHESCTKASIAKDTSLSIATCSTILNEMMESSEILKIDQENAVIGRPASLFSYNRDYQHVLGLCLSVHQELYCIDCVIADALGTIIHQELLQPEQITATTIEETVSTFLKDDPKITAVGIGIPGVAQDGLVEYCDIAALHGVDLSAKLQEVHNIEVLVENDMNLVTYHLYNTRLNGSGSLATIFFPEIGYVGCGFMINGHIIKGSSMFAGEISFAARAFGISPDAQVKRLSDRNSFCEFASQMLLTVICTINPTCAILTGNAITETDLDCIRAHCQNVVSDKHIPILGVDNNFSENYRQGVLRFTLGHIQFPLSM